MEPYENLDAAIERRRQLRARRRRRLYVRRALVLLCGAVLLFLMIATPFWIVRAVRNARVEHHPQSSSAANDAPSPDTTPKIPAVDKDTMELGSLVESQYAVLLDMTEGRVLAAKGADVPANPASITKVMTLLVAVENIADLDATYTVPWQVTTHVPSDAGIAGLSSGDVVTLRDLLHGCILKSGADAAVALAHYVVGNQAADVAEAEARFAQMMNARAAQLGATNTHFVNTSGLHHAQHKTTAMDMALIMAAAMENEICRQVLMAESYSSPTTQQLPENRLPGGVWKSTLFTSWLGSDRYGILAGKTGYTDQAYHTMASYTEINGHRYVFVSMYVNGKDKAVEDARRVYQEYCH